MHSHNHEDHDGHDHHGHSHGHHHHVSPGSVKDSVFITGMVLNGIYVVIQVGAGFYTHSMAMLADAGHNLGDVAALALSFFSLKLAQRKSSSSYTYGYKKTTVLASLVNAVILLITIGVLGFESVMRLLHPQPIEGGIVAIIAGIGILINLGSAMLFFRDKDHELNSRGAFLHLLTDAMVSLGVVVAGIIIYYTHWFWMDGAVSLAVLITILVGTWSLMVDSLRLTLDAVPQDISFDKIEQMILGVKDVQSMHHLHIWAMSTTENALTTHVVVNPVLTFDEKMKVIHNIKHKLAHHKIQHATIELESPEMPCHDAAC